jgi:hypothetical protein
MMGGKIVLSMKWNLILTGVSLINEKEGDSEISFYIFKVFSKQFNLAKLSFPHSN